MAAETPLTEPPPPPQQGVLLYYKYTAPPIPDLTAVAAFYDTDCTTLSLLGRVRLAPQGVNATLGGPLSSLHLHISALLHYFPHHFRGTDFKLAPCDASLLRNSYVAKECGFSSLSVRIVKELVTLSANPLVQAPDIDLAGKHLSALQFHSLLHSAGELSKDEAPVDSKKIVLLDARNLYETRIGKFETPNVETLDPTTRQYSDLPSWIDSNAEKLRGNCVLMYCTGGIRCEMASAYIRSKGAGFEKVYQLFGGIQRYLEQFPDGGFFKGKNFVYDPRISVGSTNECVIGKCLLCGVAYDDYSSRCRCTCCRMLVLVCNDCRKDSSKYVCELCQKYGKAAKSIPAVNHDVTEGRLTCDTGPVYTGNRLLTSEPGKKLRILCLHGFRQNASSFKGRTAALAKKLKSLAELVFVNAVHELPFLYQPSKTHDGCISNSPQLEPLPTRNCNKKYAWLVAPEFLGKKANDWEKIAAPFDPLQYEQQTQGFEESLSFLNSVFSEGHFDGILGFSQGAAMAALICAQRERRDLGFNFRFVILCSGFAINLEGCGKASLTCPSLHVFGNEGGGDRLISPNSSRDLASYFEDGCRMIIEHDSGHIITTRPPYIDQVKEFLRRFM